MESLLWNFVIEGLACQLPSSLRRLQDTPLLQTSLITSPSAILKYFEFLRANSARSKTWSRKTISWTEKFVDKAQQCFAFLHIKPKPKFAVEWSPHLEKINTAMVKKCIKISRENLDLEVNVTILQNLCHPYCK